MKLLISLHDSGIKKNSSKASVSLSREIIALEKGFLQFLKKSAHFKGVKEVGITLTLCGKAKIRTLNREYRNKDKATDVLSFGIYENLRLDSKPKEKSLPLMELGDLVICKEVARSQAREFGITYKQEIIHLSVHGFLHLLGYDHELSQKEEKIMEELEQSLVKNIYRSLKVS
jgi:probable rRNA maturation factor